MRVRRVFGGHRAALVVGLVAAAVRGAWVLAMSRPPSGLSDPGLYLAASNSIANGDGYTSLLGQPTAYYPPGYPYVLGALQWLVELVGAGDHLVLVIGLLQSLLGGVAAAALVVAGTRLTDTFSADRTQGPTAVPPPAASRVGIIAGLILAFWPNLVIHASVVLSETVFLAGFCVLLAALMTWIQRATMAEPDQRGRALLVAVIVLSTAWCTLVRPQSVVLLVPAAVVALGLARAGRRTLLSAATLLVVGVLIAVVPWTVRNAVVMDAFIPMSTNTGDNLCIGFHDGANGSYHLDDDCDNVGRYVDGPVVEVGRDGELRRRAFRWIADHPGRIPALSVEKVWSTFARDTDGVGAIESYGADPHLSGAQRTVLRWASNLYYWLVLAASVVGAALVVRDRSGRSGPRAVAPTANRWLVLLSVLGGVLVPMAFFGDPRFKVPVTPCLALLAALAVDRLLQRVARTGTSDTSDTSEKTASAAPGGLTTSGSAARG